MNPLVKALEEIKILVSFYDCPEDVDHAKIRDIIKNALALYSQSKEGDNKSPEYQIALDIIKKKENEGKQAGVEEAAKAYSEIVVPQTNLRHDMILTSRDAIREDVFNAFVDGAKSQPSIQSGEKGEVERLKGMLKEIVRLRSEATSTQELFPLLQYITNNLNDL